MKGRLFPTGFLFAVLLLLSVLLSGCVRYGRVIFEDDDVGIAVEIDQGPSEGYYRSYLPRIPAGHMPPPGLCRIWFPGTPPGQQPPPGNCRDLKRHVPPGAWLIRGRYR